jgi:hypothetical protein
MLFDCRSGMANSFDRKEKELRPAWMPPTPVSEKRRSLAGIVRNPPIQSRPLPNQNRHVLIQANDDTLSACGAFEGPRMFRFHCLVLVACVAAATSASAQRGEIRPGIPDRPAITMPLLTPVAPLPERSYEPPTFIVAPPPRRPPPEAKRCHTECNDSRPGCFRGRRDCPKDCRVTECEK